LAAPPGAAIFFDPEPGVDPARPGCVRAGGAMSRPARWLRLRVPVDPS